MRASYRRAIGAAVGEACPPPSRPDAVRKRWQSRESPRSTRGTTAGGTGRDLVVGLVSASGCNWAFFLGGPAPGEVRRTTTAAMVPPAMISKSELEPEYPASWSETAASGADA